MTFAEFQIRLFAYERVQLREWEKTRLIGWCAWVGSHQDPKKMPKTIEKFLPLDVNKQKKGVSDEMKQLFLEETEKYLKTVQNGKA